MRREQRSDRNQTRYINFFQIHLTSSFFDILWTVVTTLFLGVCGVCRTSSRPWSFSMRTRSKCMALFILQVYSWRSPVRGSLVSSTSHTSSRRKKSLPCSTCISSVQSSSSEKQQSLASDYRSPERSSGNFSLIGDCTVWSQDMYSFGQYVCGLSVTEVNRVRFCWCQGPRAAV